MNRKGRKGPQMQNPLAGMMDVPGGIPAGGFLGIGNPNGAQINFNNDELEDELADLLAEDNPKPPPKPVAAPKKGPVPWDQLDSMINNCMEDIGDDEEDIDDPDLENELEGMLGDNASVDSTPSNTPSVTEASTPSSGGVISILQQRVAEYQKAVEMSSGSKKKRMERQHKAVVQLLKKAQSGSTVKEDDIPSPPAGIGLNTNSTDDSESKPDNNPAPTEQSTMLTSPTSPIAPPVPTRSESSTKVPPPIPPSTTPMEVPPVSEAKLEIFNDDKLEYLQIRLVEYKSAALEAKKNNDKKSAVSHFQNMKKIQSAIDNKDVSFSIDSPVLVQTQSEPKPDLVLKSPNQQPQVKPQAPIPVASPMGQPKTAMEALLMRKTIFYEQEQKAKKENNSSKARRYGRIIKQYDAAIKLLKGGGKPDFDSLPDLPMDGFPQIPGVQAKELTLEDVMATANSAGNVDDDEPSKPVSKPAQKQPARSPSGHVSPPKAKSEMPHLPGALEAGSDGTSAYGKQLEFLNQRHQQFRKAALKEKEKGNKEGAMKYLKCMKGMEPMIQNAKRGLPVDIRKIPPPPDFADAPNVEFGKEQLQRQDSSGTGTRILNDLSNQVKKARSLSTQFTQLGNIEKAALMEKWATQSQRDMDIINMCLKRGERLPKIVYERRNIQLIKKYSDLRNNECEITMHRVLSIPGKYVGDNCFVLGIVSFMSIVEFPYPREKPFSAKTNYIKGNPNPELKFTVKVEINRGHTAFKRAVKNKSIKFVLCQKGGIFSSDKIIGQAQLALSVLESKCEVHTGLTFMDGRRPLESKIEVAVRLSEPIEASEMVNEDMEWVIVETKKGQSVTINPAQPSGNQPTIRCISVIAHEMKVEEALAERSRKTQNRTEYAKHSASKKALGEELLRVKKFMQASQQNKNQYILAIKGMIHIK